MAAASDRISQKCPFMLLDVDVLTIRLRSNGKKAAASSLAIPRGARRRLQVVSGRPAARRISARYAATTETHRPSSKLRGNPAHAGRFAYDQDISAAKLRGSFAASPTEKPQP